MARAQGRGLTVAAAADLRFALDEVMGPFRAAQPGARIEAIYGASGKLATQIRNGAPFDVFLSADREFADALHRDGFAAGPSRLYAVGHLVVWSAEPALGRLALVPLVRDARVRRFAIANPEAAPYGRRAREAMQSQGLWEAVQPKLVFVDGRDRINAGCDCEAVISGDALVLSIAAASIVAKVERDRIMVDLAQQHPGYGWETNAGYPTKAHRAAIRNLGLTPHHRRSFRT